MRQAHEAFASIKEICWGWLNEGKKTHLLIGER